MPSRVSDVEERVGGGTYVEALLAAEIESQISPS